VEEKGGPGVLGLKGSKKPTKSWGEKTRLGVGLYQVRSKVLALNGKERGVRIQGVQTCKKEGVCEGISGAQRKWSSSI